MPDPAPSRFVWPPKPLPQGDAPPPAPLPPLQAPITSLLDPEDSWPGFEVQEIAEPDPRAFEAAQDRSPPGGTPTTLHTLAFARSRPGSRSRWLDALEDCFLGRQVATWGIRAAEGAWRPDEPGDYCPRCGCTRRPLLAVTESPESRATCDACDRLRLPWSRAIRLGAYEGLLADAVRQVKFTRWRRLGTELGRALGTQIARALDEAGRARAKAAIVPVPMSTLHRWARGIDHTLVLARGAASVVGCPVVRALGRAYRPSQVLVPASQRRANVSGAFRWRKSVDGAETVIVLDDVRTTGSTLREACRVLRRGKSGRGDTTSGGGGVDGTALWIAVAAVTPDKNRV